jgi:exosortase/archaeosortase family protein
MPLSIEYLVFTVLFVLTLVTAYETSYLRKYAISTFFLGLIGFIYTADNLYPNGKWPPLQFPVFPTTVLASSVLNSMGFQTSIRIIDTNPNFGWMPYLSAWDPSNPLGRRAGFGIGWPCAGIESLLIYTVTILLFLMKSNITLKHKIMYFSVGAVVTYFINVLRIVTIFTLAMNYGMGSAEVWRFHDYYGQLYSMVWIITYPLMVMGISSLWMRIKAPKAILSTTPSPM